MHVCFLGDVMCGRLIDNSPIHSSVVPADIDMCIFNLECVITDSAPTNSEVCLNAPKYMCKHAATYKQAQIVLKTICELKTKCLCSISNNHILDYDFSGVKDTIGYLNANKIKWIGFGKDYITAWKPRIVTMKKRKIAVFSLADHFKEWQATDYKAGINYFDIENASYDNNANPNRAQWQNVEYIQDAISKVSGEVDVIVFSIHWGANYQKEVADSSREFAHWLIDNGVHVIHGHSSHHVMGVEVYRKGVIMYGCGDFLNDYQLMEEQLNKSENSFGREQYDYDSHLGFMYVLSFDDLQLSHLKLKPIQIKDGKTDFCWPVEKKKLFKKTIESCRKLNTVVIQEEDYLQINIC